MTTTRHRHRLDTTVSAYTWQVLAGSAKDTGITNRAALIDYIITDWVRLKRAAIAAAAIPDDGAGPEAAPDDPDPDREPVPA